MSKLISCSSNKCNESATTHEVVNNLSGGLWGPWWFCDKHDKEMADDLSKDAQKEALSKVGL